MLEPEVVRRMSINKGSDHRSGPSKIEFPCEYSVKVIGDAAPDFKDFVMRVVARHDPDFDSDRVAAAVRVRPSRNGRYFSVQVTMMATGEPQLKALFEELRGSGRVHMVL